MTEISQKIILKEGIDNLNLTDLKKTNVIYSFDYTNFNSIIKGASAFDSILILDIYFEHMEKIEEALTSAIKIGVNIKIIFLQKGSSFSKERSLAPGFSEQYLDKKLIQNEKMIKRLLNFSLSNKIMGSVEYRTIYQSSSFSLFLVIKSDQIMNHIYTQEQECYVKLNALFSSFSSSYPCYMIKDRTLHKIFENDFLTKWSSKSTNVVH